MHLRSSAVVPESGRFCRRAVQQGSALVGVVHLPASFVPREGVAYLWHQDAGTVGVLPEPLDDGLSLSAQAVGVGDLVRQPTWRTPVDPAVHPVRFLAAFPETNGWVVVGPSPHPVDPQQPDHQWWDIGEQGRMKAVEAPPECNGMALGQILTEHAVWPDRQGVLHTVSQLFSPWRQHLLNYQRLLAQAARDPAVSAELEQTVARSPVFSQLSIGRIDRDYCRYLANREDRGLLRIDGPQSESNRAAEAPALQACFDSLFQPNEGTAEPPRARRALR